MKTKNEVRNTTAEVNSNPLLGLMTAMGGGIEASEARGQSELVRSEVLPAKMSPRERITLESFGVVFGEPVDGDTLLIHAKLPDGWKKARTDHSMWSKLVDDKGRERASIFYKAAFYDRDAFMRLSRRYNIETDYPNEGSDLDEKFARRALVKLDGVVLFDSGWLAPPSDKAWETPAYDAAKAWLNVNRPEWESEAAYWSEP